VAAISHETGIIKLHATPLLNMCTARMIKGDKGVESIYAWGAKMGIDARGASGQGDGVHILTGPIYVCGAEPGDVLQVSCQDAHPTAACGRLPAYADCVCSIWSVHACAATAAVHSIKHRLGLAP
jgi:hypothetical protein